jgi:hypothetical protein
MSDETHPHFPQLQACKEQIAAINETLNGNGKVGLKTAVYAMKVQLSEQSLQLDELKKQGVKVQRLIWWGFGALFTANLFMKGNLGELIRVMFANL